jgi:hypothetical protein
MTWASSSVPGNFRDFRNTVRGYVTGFEAMSGRVGKMQDADLFPAVDPTESNPARSTRAIPALAISSRTYRRVAA